MRRRDFIKVIGKVIGGSAITRPFPSRAQQAGKVARIGFLGATSESGQANRLEGFRLGLRELGYTEGTNVVITYRWAEGNYERLPEVAAELPDPTELYNKSRVKGLRAQTP